MTEFREAILRLVPRLQTGPKVMFTNEIPCTGMPGSPARTGAPAQGAVCRASGIDCPRQIGLNPCSRSPADHSSPGVHDATTSRSAGAHDRPAPRHARRAAAERSRPVARGRDRHAGDAVGGRAERPLDPGARAERRVQVARRSLPLDPQLERPHPVRHEDRRSLLQFLARRAARARPLAPHDVREVPQAVARVGDRARSRRARHRIPYVTKIGDRYYNFWRDAQHERGLWRRTTLEEYRKPSPAWETVLDLDALGTAEKESWVWEGASTLQ